MKNKLILFLALSFTSAWSQNKTTQEFSLNAAVEYAFKHNVNYLNAEQDYLSAKYRKNEITGMGLPQINGSFDFKDFIKIPTSVLPNFVAPATTAVLMQAGLIPYDPSALDVSKYPPIAAQFGTKYQATAGISASQLILSSDYIVGLKAAKELMKLADKSVKRTKAETHQQVAKAYYLVLVNRERIKLLDANIERIEKLYNDTRALNEQGFVEKIDVERLEVTLNNLKTEKDKINGMAGVGELFLKFQMGYKITDSLILTDKLSEEQAKGINLIATDKLDVSARAEYKMLESQQKLMKIDYKRNKLSFMPTIVGYGSYGANALRSDFDFFDKNVTQYWYENAVVGFTFNLPIFSGFQRHFRIQQAKVAYNKSSNSLEYLKAAIQLEAAQSATAYSNALLAVEVQRKNNDLAKNIFDVAEKKYRAGIGSNIELMSAQTGLKEAESNYQNAVYDLLVARIDYMKAIGTLTP